MQSMIPCCDFFSTTLSSLGHLTVYGRNTEYDKHDLFHGRGGHAPGFFYMSPFPPSNPFELPPSQHLCRLLFLLYSPKFFTVPSIRRVFSSAPLSFHSFLPFLSVSPFYPFPSSPRPPISASVSFSLLVHFFHFSMPPHQEEKNIQRVVTGHIITSIHRSVRAISTSICRFAHRNLYPVSIRPFLVDCI